MAKNLISCLHDRALPRGSFGTCSFAWPGKPVPDLRCPAAHAPPFVSLSGQPRALSGRVHRRQNAANPLRGRQGRA